MGTCLAMMGLMLLDGAVGFLSVRKRVGGRGPHVTFFVHLPWLGLAFFQAHVAARVGRPSVTHLVPGIRMRIVHTAAVADEQRPEALDVHLLPQALRACGFGVMDGLEKLLLVQCRQFVKGHAVDLLRHLLKSANGQLVSFPVRRHVLVLKTFYAALMQALVNAGKYADTIAFGPVLLRKD